MINPELRIITWNRMIMKHQKPGTLSRLVEILRSETGCPWDRKQTPRSMTVYLTEEMHELIEAIENDNPGAVREELGDVLFHIIFLARIYQERGAFDINDVIRSNLAKMIRRHPHVFGDVQVNGTEDVKVNWHRIKMQEKGAGKVSENASMLDSVPGGLPALMRAYRISERAARTGFDWEDMAGVMDKVEEEWRELKAALRQGEQDQVATELGDVLFTLVNVARFAKVHPETALSGAIRKFETRFRHMEKAVAAVDGSLEDMSAEEMDRYWEQAKSSESENDTTENGGNID